MEDLPLVTKIVLSTAPVDRCTLFEQLLSTNKTRLTTQEFADLTDVHPSTARRTMTELKIIGLVTLDKNEAHEKDSWQIELKNEFSWFRTEEFRIVKKDYDTPSYKNYLKRLAEAESEESPDGSGSIPV